MPLRLKPKLPLSTQSSTEPLFARALETALQSEQCSTTANQNGEHTSHTQEPDNDQSKEPPNADQASHGTPRGSRFWALMAALTSTAILAALEGTIVSTALPTISNSLNGGSSFLWTVNAYFLTSTAIQPLYGQLADVLGRKTPLIAAVLLFLAGSAVCGAAQNIGMLIAARCVQGLGAGGLQMLVSLVVADVVPLRERSSYLSFIFGVTTLANGLGPLFSGLIVERTTWRWVFFLSLPLGAVVLILVVFCMQTKPGKIPPRQGLRNIDLIGSLIFIMSVTSLLIALTYAGSKWSWGSWHIIVPLVLGVVGLIAFLLYEGSGMPIKPNMPLHIFANRTSTAALTLSFFHSVLTLWVIYFMPVYFQGVLLYNPEKSGLLLLPTILILLPLAMVGGRLLKWMGRYRRIHISSFAIIVLGFGLFIRLDTHSSTAYIVCTQALVAIGAGLVVGTLLPAAQAPHHQRDVSAVTATFSFMKNFGSSLAVTIPTALFNSKFESLSGQISDATLRHQLSGGNAYQSATAEFLNKVEAPVREQVAMVYAESLRFIWIIGTGVAGFAFLLTFFEKHYELRTTVKSDYGLREVKSSKRRGSHSTEAGHDVA